jgi:hypothetical protein
MSTANLDGADLAAVNLGGLINEDVMQQIFDISDIALPFTDMIGSGSHDNSFAEWTSDRLADPDLTNAVVDGADAGTDDSAVGIRVANHSQISQKTLRVSTRAQDSSTIGFANSLAYQVMMRGNEARRDVEAIMLSVQASVADDGAAVAGLSAGLGAWIVDTDIFGTASGLADRGALGADGGWLDTPTDGLVAAPTAGTTRALSLSTIQDVLQAVWSLGGDPTILMARPEVIRPLSTFMFTSSAQIATLERDTASIDSAAKALMSVNVLITDFGVTVKMIANRLQAVAFTDNDNLYVITPAMALISFLTGWQTAPLARTGTADNRQVTADWTLKVLNWEAFGVVADIDATAAVVA